MRNFFFVSRWNPPAPFGLVVLYEFFAWILTTYIQSVYTSYLLPSSCLPGKTFLDIEQVVRCIPVYPRPTSRRISIWAELAPLQSTGSYFTTDGSLASLMPGTGFSRVLLCRSGLCSRWQQQIDFCCSCRRASVDRGPA